MSELIIPPAAQEDPESFELLRVWAAHEEQHVTINTDLNGDEEDFGQMLADLAFHGANLYSEKAGVTIEVVMTRLIKAFNEALNDTESERTGGIMK